MKYIKLIIFLAAACLVSSCGAADEGEVNQATTQPLPSPTRQSPAPLPAAAKETAPAEKNSPIPTPRSPLSTPTPSLTEEIIIPETPPGTEALIDQAKAMLSQLPGSNDLTKDDISLKTVEERQWRDSSLGCPREGMMYNQVITAGYLIVLEAEGKAYEFHTNTRDGVVLCFIDGEDAVKALQP